jgi:hypothetical protein
MLGLLHLRDEGVGESMTEISEIRVLRVDSLPYHTRCQLAELGIRDGLVRLDITENSPKTIIKIEQTKLPSDLIREFEGR